jgi:hypothetical protein
LGLHQRKNRQGCDYCTGCHQDAKVELIIENDVNPDIKIASEYWDDNCGGYWDDDQNDYPKQMPYVRQATKKGRNESYPYGA